MVGVIFVLMSSRCFQVYVDSIYVDDTYHLICSKRLHRTIINAPRYLLLAGSTQKKHNFAPQRRLKNHFTIFWFNQKTSVILIKVQCHCQPVYLISRVYCSRKTSIPVTSKLMPAKYITFSNLDACHG